MNAESDSSFETLLAMESKRTTISEVGEPLTDNVVLLRNLSSGSFPSSWRKSVSITSATDLAHKSR